MAHNFDYECPHCKQIVNVAQDRVGESVDCTSCGEPFQARVPVARQVNSEDSASPVTGSGGAGSKTASEEVLKELHPVMFRNHLILTVLAVGLAIGGVAGTIMWLAGNQAWGLTGSSLLIASLIGLAVAAGFILYEWIQVLAVKLTVTNQRTIVTHGILSHRTNEIQHDDVRNIHCDQNLLERMFNYGDIALSSSGQDYMEIVVKNIPHPHAVVELIRRYQ